jgi:two-component system response regulator RegA
MTAWARRVLVVDDGEAFAARVAQELERRDWAVTVASTLERALKVIGASNFENIVLEPNLGGHSWYATLRATRAAAPKARIVITTAFPSTAMRRQARSERCRDFLEKPVSPGDVESCLTGISPASGVTTISKNGRSLARADWEYVNAVLRRCLGNMSEAARSLNIPRQTLYRKLRKFPPNW